MNTIQAISLFLIALVLCPGCDNDDDYTPQPLPYFYCKINGQNFAARGKWQCQSRTFNYYPNGFMNSLPGTVVMIGNDCETWETVGLNLFGFHPSNDTLYLVNSTSIDSSRAYFLDIESPISFGLSFDQVVSGHVIFDSFSDKQNNQNGIVSGTFEFTVKNVELDSTVAITEGRFQYIIDYEWY